jgi:hypothetical protein
LGGIIVIKVISITLLLSFAAIAQEVIDISVKGISDNKNEGTQKDRKEAVMDAKRQACEKAGLQIKSKTTIENFQTVFDFIESESEAILLPGFQIIDIGYVADGTYQVVLTGKIKLVVEEKISAKELRYAKSLKDRGKWSECKKILLKYIDGKDEEVSDAVKEEALYLYIKWGFSFNVQEECEKFAAFYPESDKVSKILSFNKFASKPVLSFNKEYVTDSTKWIVEEYEHKKTIYEKQIKVVTDTIRIKDFSSIPFTLIIDLSIFKTEDTSVTQPLAYYLKLSYFEGNINKISKDKDIKIIDEKFKQFTNTGTNTFQRSSSGNWFKYFALRHYQIDGNVPFGSEKYKYKIKFDVHQNGF